MKIRLFSKDLENEDNSFIGKIKYLFKFLSKAVLYALMFLFVVVVLAILVYFVDTYNNKKNGVNKAPLFNAFVIVSQSMVPNIKVNDAVVIKRIEPEDLKIGDIITFSSTDPNYVGLIVTHRIVGKELSQNGDYIFRTKGDNNNVEDSALVHEDKIYGKVFLKIPKLGYVRYILTTKKGFVLFIIFPTICFVIFDIIKLIKKLIVYFNLINSSAKDDDDVVIEVDDDTEDDSEVDSSDSGEEVI